MVQARQSELRLAASPRSRRARVRRETSWHRAVLRHVGLGLIRAGRRLAGPDDARRVPLTAIRTR